MYAAEKNSIAILYTAAAAPTVVKFMAFRGKTQKIAVEVKFVNFANPEMSAKKIYSPANNTAKCT